ncbi:hypothetical protein ACH51_19590 (plasmid) [Ralstonia solanacearum]|nr:hypothetical protein ACH51_19590 [Ralstonia solanacearum]
MVAAEGAVPECGLSTLTVKVLGDKRGYDRQENRRAQAHIGWKRMTAADGDLRSADIAIAGALAVLER